MFFDNLIGNGVLECWSVGDGGTALKREKTPGRRPAFQKSPCFRLFPLISGCFRLFPHILRGEGGIKPQSHGGTESGSGMIGRGIRPSAGRRRQRPGRVALPGSSKRRSVEPVFTAWDRIWNRFFRINEWAKPPFPASSRFGRRKWMISRFSEG